MRRCYVPSVTNRKFLNVKYIFYCRFFGIAQYSRDHSVAEGLDYVAMHNMGMLCSEDVAECQSAMMSKSKPSFNDIE